MTRQTLPLTTETLRGVYTERSEHAQGDTGGMPRNNKGHHYHAQYSLTVVSC